MRIFATSDLHTDFKENWLLIKSLPETVYREDALIVAGDIASRYETIRDTLALLRSRFGRVFYTPGNHELWVRGERHNSLDKLSKILDLCRDIDVCTEPGKAGGYWVVPLFSWYDSGFDAEGAGNPAKLDGWGDFHFCRWPDGITPISDHFLRLNETRIRTYDGPVISFSHFLPRKELLPAPDRLFFKGLPSVAGCTNLDEQVRELQSAIHVFGHSHINCDRVIEGVRYVQNAVLYPRERTALEAAGRRFWQMDGPLLQLAEA